MVNAKINGIAVEVPEGTTVLEAAMHVQVRIPTLCKHPDLVATGACGICVVRVAGSPRMIRACTTPLLEGVEIVTHDPEIVEIRRTVIEMILSKHPNECLTCGRNGTCELQQLVADFGIRRESFAPLPNNLPNDDSTKTLHLEPRKCITCGRCVLVCQEVQNVWALSFLERGFNTRISPAGDISLAESPCVRCGQCSAHCPTGAIFEYDETQKAWDALKDPNKYCIVQIAPSVRVSIGEAFDFEPGLNLTGKLYAALRRLGFKTVFDTNFGADVTIMEEATEFIQRLVKGRGPLPMITTCCPSWVDFLEKFYGDQIDHFSSCKSPHEILGVLSKTYYAQKMGLDPAKICMMSIMPCTSKKYEIRRSADMSASGYQDVDISLTTRELSRMIKQAGVDFDALEPDRADDLLGEYSGAGTIFAATGGVMEAALRTAHQMITGKEMEKLELEAIRGLKGIKEAELEIGGHTVRVAAAHGLGNVGRVLDRVREAEAHGEDLPYHFIEVMACPGGCIGGGGQPYGITDEIRQKRMRGIVQDDRQQQVRCSHQNPSVQQLYKEFLGEPLGEKSHHYLHTHYKPRPTYQR